MDKTGTTWMQQTCRAVIFRGDGAPLWNSSPWVMRPVPLRSSSRRLKRRSIAGSQDAPADRRAGVLVPRPSTSTSSATAGTSRGASTTTTLGFTDQAYPMFNNVFGREGPRSKPPTGDVVQYFHEWLNGRRSAVGVSFWEHVQGWYNARHLPNMLLVHFNDLKADLPEQMRRIAAFLGIVIDEPRFQAMSSTAESITCGERHPRRRCST